MSVLSCDRRDCESVMCDRLSHKYGYICSDCLEELVNLGEGTNIKGFMNTSKDASDPEEEHAARDYFESVFKYK